MFHVGRRCDNPAVPESGYDENTTKSQFFASLIAGNVQGPVGNFNEMCSELFPKIKKLICPKVLIVTLVLGFFHGKADRKRIRDHDFKH